MFSLPFILILHWNMGHKFLPYLRRNMLSIVVAFKMASKQSIISISTVTIATFTVHVLYTPNCLMLH